METNEKKIKVQKTNKVERIVSEIVTKGVIEFLLKFGKTGAEENVLYFEVPAGITHNLQDDSLEPVVSSVSYNATTKRLFVHILDHDDHYIQIPLNKLPKQPNLQISAYFTNLDKVEYKGKKYWVRTVTHKEAGDITVGTNDLQDELIADDGLWVDGEAKELDEKIHNYVDEEKLLGLNYKDFYDYINENFT